MTRNYRPQVLEARPFGGEVLTLRIRVEFIARAHVFQLLSIVLFESLDTVAVLLDDADELALSFDMRANRNRVYNLFDMLV